MGGFVPYDGPVIGANEGSRASAPAGFVPYDGKVIGAPKVTRNVNESMQDAFGNGLLMNFGDEVKAGVQSVVSPAIQSVMDWVGDLDKKLGLDVGGAQKDFKNSPVGQASVAPDVGTRYDENLARERANAKAFEKSNPILAAASNIAGNVAGSSALLAAAPAGLTSMGPSLVLNALKGAAVGGTLGAVSGYGEGEGDGRLGSAMVGGGTGAVAGGVAPAVIAGGQQLYERFAPNALRFASSIAEGLVPKVKPQNLSAAAPDGTAGVAGDSLATRFADFTGNAATKIEDQAALKRLALAMTGRSGPDEVQQVLKALGKDAFIGDASKGTERLAFVTQANSDDAAENMLKAYVTRNKATGTRFKAEVPGAPDARSANDFLSAYTSAEGSKIYDPVLRKGTLNVSDELTALTQRPSIKKALETVDEWAVAEGKALTEAERFHMVKQALNQNSDAAFASGKPINKKMVGDTAADWEAALYRANPKIQEADQAYAKVASLPEHFERGQNFAARGRGETPRNASPEALQADLPNMTPDQRNVLAAGARSDMRRIASEGPDQTRRLAKNLTDGDDMVGRLHEILGPETTDRIISRANAERTFAEKFGNVMRGSQTAERNQSLIRDQGLSPPASGDVMAVLRWARDTADKVNTPSEAVRRKLGDLLTNPDAASNAETIELVKELLRKRAPYNAIRAAAPGAAGGELAGP